MSNPTLPYYPATLLRRLAAATYDGLLILALWMAGTMPLLLLYKGEAIPADSLWYPVYLLSITGIFHAWFWSHGGQTLGMRAWRLWVIDENGKQTGFRQALKRYIASVFAWASLIGLVWCVFEPRGLALHDLVSRTRITHIPK